MISDKLLSAAEAVLFACGDPVESGRLAAAVGVSEEQLTEIADGLKARYESCGSALTVLRLGNMWQLGMTNEYAENVRTAADTRRNTPLSAAAMEVLTIVAYNQPVSKAFVEHVRSVDSSSVVNSLVEKNLLEEAGRLDVPGRPLAYRTTPVFLRCFGLESLDDLPPLPDFKKADFAEMLTDEGGQEDGEDGSDV